MMLSVPGMKKPPDAMAAYPTVLTDTLRRHADAGDPTCRLVLDWLLAKSIAKTGTGSALHEGAV